MFNLDEEKIEFALDNRALVFWQGKKAENVVIFISEVEIRGIYLNLTLGTAKFKQQSQNNKTKFFIVTLV